MILVGIDVASEKHDVCIMRDTTEVVRSPFTIPNDASGMKKLLDEIDKAKKLFPDDGIRIGLESTGVYSAAICEMLANKFSGRVVLINPVLTSMFQLSQSVQYAKTDRKDALGICKFLSRNEDIRPYAVVSYHTRALRQLYRERTKLNKRLNQDENRLKGLLHVGFPEFLSKKNNTLGLFELEFLRLFPTAASLKDMAPGKVIRKLSKTDYLRIDEERIKGLIAKAKTSIGSATLDGFTIVQTVERVIFYKSQIKEIDKEIGKLVKEEYPDLLTIPGVGAVTIAGIVGEIGNIGNIRSSDALVALAGLNPIVYQSGKFNASHTSISKKGSSYLRNALFLATKSMYLHRANPIYDFVNKKRKEGKRMTTAIDHGARKLCNIIFHLMKHKEAFRDVSATN